MKKIIVLFFLMLVQIFPQNNEAEKILQKVRDNYNKVNDYVVDVHVKVDVSFLKAPDSDAKIYYKKPDKLHIESKAFAMLPKNGMTLSPLSLIKDNYIAILEKEEYIDNVKNYVIRVIPSDGTSEIILSTFWIDSRNYVVKRLNGETRNSGKYSIDFIFDNKNSFNLPSEMIFSFNMEKNNTPNLNDPGAHNESSRKKKEMKGKVYLKYSNYVINKGVSDDIFLKK